MNRAALISEALNTGAANTLRRTGTRPALQTMQRELARRELLYFIQYTKADYQTNWHHRLICEKIMRWLNDDTGKHSFLMIFTPPRHGKALHVDTPIPTPDGWVKISDLKAGDTVFDETGAPCKVTAKSEVFKDRPVFRVSTDDGHEIIADASHEWNVRLCRKHKAVTTRTTQYLWDRKQRIKDYRRPCIQKHGALKLPKRRLSMDPYLLGLWLGDGRSAYGFITSGHEGDRDFIKKEIESAGYVTRSHKDVKNFGIMGMQKIIRELNLINNKHVPDEYLWASESQRLALLQGLIDSDGHVASDGQIEFCSIDKNLAEDVQHLVHSLGYKASLITGPATIDGRYISEKYRVMFYMPNAARIPRKKERCIKPKRVNRYIETHEAGTADTVCIQVDSPSNLFLCGRAMIPTHNSEIVSRRLPPFIFGRNPDAEVLNASYGAELAQRMNRDVQRVIDSKEYQSVFDGTKLKSVGLGQSTDKVRTTKMFEILDARGSLVSAGVDGALTGYGGDYIIIDDPVKDMKEALSPTKKKRVKEWYDAVVQTRLESGGKVLLTLTRWAEDDLAGYLLDVASKDPKATQWDVLSLPAIKYTPKAGDAAIVSDDDPREDGEALWPEKKTKADLLRIEAGVASRVWNSLYQQNPRPESGDIWRASDFIVIADEDIPAGLYKVGTDWDLAYTENEANSASAYIAGGVHNNNAYITGVGYFYLEFPDLIDEMKRTRPDWPKYIEDKASGKSAAQTLSREGVDVNLVEVEGDKLSRTYDVVSHGRTGRVYVAQSAVKMLLNDPKQGVIQLSPENLDIDLNDALTQFLRRTLGKYGVDDWDALADDPDLMNTDPEPY